MYYESGRFLRTPRLFLALLSAANEFFHPFSLRKCSTLFIYCYILDRPTLFSRWGELLASPSHSPQNHLHLRRASLGKISRLNPVPEFLHLSVFFFFSRDLVGRSQKECLDTGHVCVDHLFFFPRRLFLRMGRTAVATFSHIHALYTQTHT